MTATDTSPLAGARHGLAPQALYVTDDDFLRVSVLGAGTQVIRVSGRMLTPLGEVKTLNLELAAPASRATAATAFLPLGCGWLEHVTAIALSAGTGIAQTFVTVDLVRGPAAAGGVMATLLQGFVSSINRRAWPGSLIQSSLDGPGVIRSITGTDPGAGVEISETVPAGARWRLRAFTYLLVTSAVVAARESQLIIDDGANILAIVGPSITQAASVTGRFTLNLSNNFGASNAIRALPLPGDQLTLLPGYRIRTNTVLLDTGDNYGAPQYEVEEWMEGA